MRAKLLHTALAALAALAITACAPRAVVAPLPAPAPEGPVTAEMLRERIVLAGVAGMSAEVKARIMRGEERVATASGALAYQAGEGGGRLALRLFSPFGSAVFELVSAGDGSARAYDPKSRTMYIGRVPPLVPGADADVMMDEDEAHYYLYLRGDGALTEYAFDRATLRNVSVATASRNGGSAALVIDAYGAGTVPEAMTLEFPGGMRVRLELMDVELGGELPGSAFLLEREVERVMTFEEFLMGRPE